ncbi:MAG TPA: ATP-dependent 6-phosphofructokinase [Syntrophorhabdaceae bacterium]|nr:ATP-dependent 6-phosphofructokinase [Syntrophorhabdaceae bacterium]
MKKVKRIGILTAGGDCPGLNAAIRGVGKAALGRHGIEVIGIRDGFLGLIENRTLALDGTALAGILTIGGTILGTSRIKPHRMDVKGVIKDLRDLIVRNYEKNRLDALVCIGGGGTAKNALRLTEKGLNIVHLPKTIDNDVAMTDTSFGFDTALAIATEAIDRLHSTAHSHHRIIVAEVMGHRTGWLTLGAGIAGGADVILIPEIPYNVKSIAKAIRARMERGMNFSIVAVAEGALSREYANRFKQAKERKAKARDQEALLLAKAELAELDQHHSGNTLRLAHQLERLTGLESRITILGYVQRGGTPSAVDRLLATRLGTASVDFIRRGIFGVMVGAYGDGVRPVPLADVTAERREVQMDHAWVQSARAVGTCLGD